MRQVSVNRVAWLKFLREFSDKVPSGLVARKPD